MSSLPALKDAIRHQLDQKLYHAALPLLQQLLASYPQDADLHYQRGICLSETGKKKEAFESFILAERCRPDFINAIFSMASLLIEQGNHEAATRYLLHIHSREPENAVITYRLATTYQQIHHFPEAREFFLKTIILEPAHAHAYGGLAHVEEFMGRMDEAVDAARRALEFKDDQPLALLTMAKYHRRREEHEEALAMLERLLGATKDARLQGIANHEKGRVLAKLERYGESFAAYTEGNAVVQRSLPTAEQGKAEYARQLEGWEKLISRVEEAGSWPAPPAPSDSPTPYFLVGFPRSGTTLTEQILHSHSQLMTTSERPMLAHVVEHAGRETGLDLPADTLSLPEEIWPFLREKYWALARDYCRLEAADWETLQAGKTFLFDKLPLNLCRIPFILRLFPETKILLLIRDPRDAVLSAFMHVFEGNDAMSHFYTLQDVATLYDRVMRMWARYEKALPVAFHRLHYESLVAAAEEALPPLFSFLELPWEESVTRYYETSRGRVITTPSYEGVRSPLYTHAQGRWRRFEKELAPVLPLLEPWCKHWGYL